MFTHTVIETTRGAVALGVDDDGHAFLVEGLGPRAVGALRGRLIADAYTVDCKVSLIDRTQRFKERAE
jgi:hypothetical protein